MTSNDPSKDNNWFKWSIGILVSLLAAGSGIVAILGYIHPAPRAQPSAIGSLTGTWNYTMKSNVSGRTYQGFMHLAQDGTSVNGDMDDPGGTPGKTTGVAGTYVSSTLTLSRNTGMNTAQDYRLSDSGQQLAGTFNNIGDYPDSGTIEIKR